MQAYAWHVSCLHYTSALAYGKAIHSVWVTAYRYGDKGMIYIGVGFGLAIRERNLADRICEALLQNMEVPGSRPSQGRKQLVSSAYNVTGMEGRVASLP